MWFLQNQCEDQKNNKREKIKKIFTIAMTFFITFFVVSKNIKVVNMMARMVVSEEVMFE